jgi:hypothetical protein
MKYDALEEQLKRQQGLTTLFGEKAVAAAEPAPEPSAEPPARRNRKQVDGSKRSSWKMRAWYVQPETASRLRAYVNRQQEAGSSIDASDVVDQAIAAWLDQQGG